MTTIITIAAILAVIAVVTFIVTRPDEPSTGTGGSQSKDKNPPINNPKH